MDRYDRHYTSYRYWQDGLFTPPNSGRCPYCRHQLPECDCGYGLMALEPQKPVVRTGLKKIFKVLNQAVKRFFVFRRHKTLLLHR
jgi:hypothetical protein